jgi:hypothetical protein
VQGSGDPVTVIRTLSAETPTELVEIGWRMHDAQFDPDNVTFDCDLGRVQLGFDQEPRDLAAGLPASAFVRSTRLFDEYAVPFLRYRLVVNRAIELRLSDDLRESANELISVDFDQPGQTLHIWANSGKISIRTTGLRVVLEITDEIADVRRRRVGKGPRWDSTAPWRRDEKERMSALVLEPHAAPALHEVSAIVRRPA